MKDLWPEDIAHAEDLGDTPLGILKEQASSLGKRTKNIVKAEVRPIPSDSFGNEFIYEFVIIAPFLEDYRYMLFRIRQNPMSLYPFTVSLDETLTEELFTNRHNPIQVCDQGGFEKLLTQIFNANSTKNLIKLLINQSKTLSSEEFYE